MHPLKTITFDEIAQLLKKYLGVVIARTTIYQWMRDKGFPNNSGLGVPRRWREDQVMAWIQNQIKKTDSPPARRKKK